MAKTETAPKRGKFAFQCKNCGAVEPPEAAGDNDVPSACHACRQGVNDPSNWIVLADLSDAELKKGFPIHGLTRADVVSHKGSGKPPEGAKHTRHVTERVGSKDRG